MIQISNIHKIYPTNGGSVEALKDVSLNIKRGEIFGIIGKSGAGKSTLIRCINMLEKPTSGTVLVDSQNLTAMQEKELRQARQKIGMIFQHFNLLSSRTVFGNIAFPLELQGQTKQQIHDKVMPLLELVGLQDKKDHYPAQLSGGQKQRVGIARALANDPKVLLCDEATSALDPQTTKSILELLKNINKKLQLTIVLITHEMQVIKQICDQVAVIENGHIIEQGPVLKTFTQPQADTTREFVGTIMNSELPTVFLTRHQISNEQLPNSNLILRLSFIGQSAETPIIAEISRQFNVNPNILLGNIDQIHNTPYGTLVIELSGEPQNIDKALQYLKSKDLRIEVIGYVSRNARSTG